MKKSVCTGYASSSLAVKQSGESEPKMDLERSWTFLGWNSSKLDCLDGYSSEGQTTPLGSHEGQLVDRQIRVAKMVAWYPAVA